jgi:hypothetical protein
MGIAVPARDPARERYEAAVRIYEGISADYQGWEARVGTERAALAKAEALESVRAARAALVENA